MLQAQSDAAGEQPIAFGRFVVYVLKFHQSLRSRKGTDEERNVARQLACRTLNLPYELDKSDECAVGNQAPLQTDRAPREGKHIAGDETGIDDRRRNCAVFCFAERFAGE